MRIALGLGLGLTYGGGAPAVFDPATLAWSSLWRASYDGSPWEGTASAGTSGTHDLTEATNPPAAGTAVNGFAPALFDGTNDRLLNGASFDAYYTSEEYGGQALINAAAVSTNNATEYDNVCILSTQSSAYWFLFLKSTGVVGLAHYGNDTNRYVVTAPFSIGAWQYVQWKFVDGVIYLRVNGGDWETIEADDLHAVGLAASTMGVGINTGTPVFLNGSLLELGTAQAAFSDAVQDQLLAEKRARYGLALT